MCNTCPSRVHYFSAIHAARKHDKAFVDLYTDDLILNLVKSNRFGKVITMVIVTVNGNLIVNGNCDVPTVFLSGENEIPLGHFN